MKQEKHLSFHLFGITLYHPVTMNRNVFDKKKVFDIKTEFSYYS